MSNNQPRTTTWQTRLGSLLGVLLLVALIAPYLIPLPATRYADTTPLAGPEGRFITVAGTRTYIREAGPTTGPAVVLVHGFGASTFSWRETVPALAEAGFHVLALDLRGFGLADKTFEADYSHAAQADFVMAVMTALGIERATLVGHSMGGNVIAHVALRHLQRVEALVFVAGAVVTGTPPLLSPTALLNVPPVRQWARVLLTRSLTPEQVAETQLTAYAVKDVVTPAVRQGYLNVLDVRDWDLALLGVVRDGAANALAQPLSDITAPVMIVWGEQDSWVPLDPRGLALRQAFPAAQWVVYPGIGHLPQEENPAEFNRDVIAFVQRLPR